MRGIKTPPPPPHALKKGGGAFSLTRSIASWRVCLFKNRLNKYFLDQNVLQFVAHSEFRGLFAKSFCTCKIFPDIREREFQSPRFGLRCKSLSPTTGVYKNALVSSTPFLHSTKWNCSNLVERTPNWQQLPSRCKWLLMFFLCPLFCPRYFEYER